MELKEVNFFTSLEDFLVLYNLDLIRQYQILSYRVDCYIPKINLIIEFDEEHHKYNIELDKKRESKIKNKLKCQFIRCKSSDSIGYNLGIISLFILKREKQLKNGLVEVLSN
jgi:very-short-patch-repair endonuclease